MAFFSVPVVASFLALGVGLRHWLNPLAIRAAVAVALVCVFVLAKRADHDKSALAIFFPSFL